MIWMIPFNKEYSEKEIAIFNGIVELLNQGRRIHELKVSDISAAAGIGKSTAYEYFTSKEEILRQAIRYHMMREYSAVAAFVDRHDCFLSLLHHTMDYVEDMLINRFPSLLMMFLSLDRSEAGQIFAEDCELINIVQRDVEKMFEIVWQTGQRDGLIAEDISATDCKFILSGLLTSYSNELRFKLLTGNDSEFGAVQAEDLKRQTVRLILKALQ